MSLVSNSEIVNDCIKNILQKYNFDNDSIKLSTEYNKLIETISDISFQCFTNKNLIHNIENNYPKHFEITQTTTNDDNLKDDIWIFGYGSLIWKVDFPYEICQRGYICGYNRRFYQNSLDHRGVPEKPGRVVTCIPCNDGRVYGVAYKIPLRLKNEVLNHLDYREKNGYERCILNFYQYPDSNKTNFQVIMYIATAENQSYAGHISDTKEIAEQIYWAWGPSGSNREYVYNLSVAMNILFPDVNDDHLVELKNELEKQEALDKEIETEIQKKLKNEIFELLKNNTSTSGLISQIESLIENLKKEVYNAYK